MEEQEQKILDLMKDDEYRPMKAKEIAMIQRNEKGKEVRQYFIQVEKDFNSPEKIMARALKIAENKLNVLQLENAEQKKTLEEQKPKVIFANSVETAKTSGAKVVGPVPLPTEKDVVTILRAVHKYKDAREQFERRTHKRLIDIKNPSKQSELDKNIEFGLKIQQPSIIIPRLQVK